jgi:hypothetical protein
MASYKKVHPAMIAVWAALISVSGLLPTFPVSVQEVILV